MPRSAALPNGAATSAEHRAACLERAADLLESRRGFFIALLQQEGGKTLDDALAELREAVDFCRYYAQQGRAQFGADMPLPGPTGESNHLRLRGRGVFVAISPWNFPLAIFVGQIAAALMAGNAVVAKPAEQTPRIAFEATKLLHEAGVPPTRCIACRATARSARRWWRIRQSPAWCSPAPPRWRGRSTARSPPRTAPIVPLIAETGGINAMIVDATALPEQVADDVITSAFRSAGQRCSALRLLLLQHEVADRMIEIIVGAAQQLRLGDPRDPAVHIGPVIDAEAAARLNAHVARMRREARIHFAGDAPGPLFVAPHVIELQRIEQLSEEVFGPILHVVRYDAARSRRGAGLARCDRLRPHARHSLPRRRHHRRR